MQKHILCFIETPDTEIIDFIVENGYNIIMDNIRILMQAVNLFAKKINCEYLDYYLKTDLIVMFVLIT